MHFKESYILFLICKKGDYHFLGYHCSMSLGLEDGRIGDAATIYSSKHAARLGRLNLVARSGNAGAWHSKLDNNKQWLQIDLGQPTTVTKIATQGRQDSSHWVKNYSLSYSLTSSYWVHYTVRGKKKVTPLSINCGVQVQRNLMKL